ncbi:MAG: hypothetical protein PHR45_05690 [Muribaculaceae bacterium]|nr:hypothetical protein [Muribaculaceae bacterium]
MVPTPYRFIEEYINVLSMAARESDFSTLPQRGIMLYFRVAK